MAEKKIADADYPRFDMRRYNPPAPTSYAFANADPKARSSALAARGTYNLGVAPCGLDQARNPTLEFTFVAEREHHGKDEMQERL